MRKSFLCAVLPALVLTAIALGPACSESRNSGSTMKTIVLHHVSPDVLMRLLGLIGPAESPAPPASDVIPPGVDLVGLDPRDKALIVIGGEKSAVEQLAAIIAACDVPPQKVQVKAEVFKLDVGQSKKLGLDWSLQNGKPIASASPGVMKKLRESLGQPIYSLTADTANGHPATAQESSDEQVLRMAVTPRVNADKTITLHVEWSTTLPAASVSGAQPSGKREQSLKTNRRVRDGESVVVGGFENPGAGGEILVVTARVVN